LVHSEPLLSLQHVNKKVPNLLQQGGLSGGATSADSKKIYPIDLSNMASDSVMYVSLLLNDVVSVYVFCAFFYLRASYEQVLF